MEKVEFYIIRHGETMLNKLGKAQGWVDSPLTINGVSTARNLSKNLLPLNFSAVYCSDLPRARKTAEIFAADRLPIFPDSRLREWCLGIFEAEKNKTFIQGLRDNSPVLQPLKNIDSRLDEVANLVQRLDTTGFAESFEGICRRLQDFLHTIGDEQLQSGGGRIAVVTHAFIMKTFLYLYAYDKLLENIKIGHENLEIIVYDGQNFSLEFH